jgi:hypothetical protein
MKLSDFGFSFGQRGGFSLKIHQRFKFEKKSKTIVLLKWMKYFDRNLIMPVSTGNH